MSKEDGLTFGLAGLVAFLVSTAWYAAFGSGLLEKAFWFYAAKAILDAIKGYAFHDDAQVARLLVERAEGQREQITIIVRRLSGAGHTGPLRRAGEVRR